MHRLPHPQRRHYQRLISNPNRRRYGRRALRSRLFYEAGPPCRLPPSLSQSTRYSQESVPHLQWPLLISSHAIRIMQCAVNLSDDHELHFSAISQEVYFGFFYDILIYSPTWDSHLDHVKQAMEILKQYKFFYQIQQMHIRTAGTRVLGAYCHVSPHQSRQQKNYCHALLARATNHNRATRISRINRILPKVCARI